MTAENKQKCLHFGQYKGVPLNKVPLGHLAWVYGSFMKPRKVVEPELRRRGMGDHDLPLVRKKFPFIAKSPEKQTAKKCPPTVFSRQRPASPPNAGRLSWASPSAANRSHPPALPCTDRQLPSVRTSTLKQIYGESNGTDKAVDEELRNRGFNTRELTEIQWSYNQRRWREQAKKAHKVARRRRQAVSNAKNRRHRKRRKERRRQEQLARVARLKEGVVITGENFDPSASDGSCPF